MGRKSSVVTDTRSNRLDKQAEKQKRSKVYSSEIIAQIVKDQATGGEPDMEPFFHGQTEYRDSGIAFEYTDHEMTELIKCSEDPIYFVETYCKFLNDKGRTTIKLRDYQKKLLGIYTAEKYDPVSDSNIPINSQIIVMQSRQTGKCVTGDTLISVDDSVVLDYGKLTFTSYIKRKWKQLINKLTNCFHYSKSRN